MGQNSQFGRRFTFREVALLDHVEDTDDLLIVVGLDEAPIVFLKSEGNRTAMVVVVFLAGRYPFLGGLLAEVGLLLGEYAEFVKALGEFEGRWVISYTDLPDGVDQNYEYELGEQLGIPIEPSVEELVGDKTND